MDKKGTKTYNIDDKIKGNKRCQQTFVIELKGCDLKYSHFQEYGFKSPILIKDKSGLGMRVPSQSFTMNDIRKCIGSKKMVQVITFKDEKKGMTMEEFTRMMETKKEELKALERFNFTGSKLETYVEQPEVVQQLDWANLISPKQEFDNETFSPKVQRFFSMTMSGNFNNFSIDYHSQWVHLLHGKMILWLISLTSANYEAFSEWKRNGEQYFFADELATCQKLKVEHGWTLFIPSGWIVAQYTLEDALLISGSFLNCFSMVDQIEAYKLIRELDIEDSKEFTCFKQKLWYILDSYLEVIIGRSRRHWSREEMISGECMGQGHEKVISSSNEDTDVEDATNDSQETKPETAEKSSSSTSNVIKVVTVKLQNCLLSQSKNEAKIFLTSFELEGLKCVIDFLLVEKLTGFPSDLSHPEGIINDIKKFIQDSSVISDFKISVTGKPIMSFRTNEETNNLPCKISSHLRNCDPEHSINTLPPPSSSSSSTSSSTCIPSIFPSSSHVGSNRAPPLDPTTYSPIHQHTWVGKDSALRRRRVRCKRCEPCTRGECGECHFCKDMKKFGGQGKMKQTCTARQCLAPNLSTSAVCSLCGQGDFLHTPTSLPQQHPASSTDQPITVDDLFIPDQHPEGSIETVQKVSDPLIIIVNNNLMECSICWKITHPLCFKLTYPELNQVESVINDDLPNSWDCPSCCEAGKSVQKKPKPAKFCTYPLMPSLPSSLSSSSSIMSSSIVMKRESNSDSDDEDSVGEASLMRASLGSTSRENINKKSSKNYTTLESHEARKRNWCELMKTCTVENKKMKLNLHDNPTSKDIIKVTPVSSSLLPDECNRPSITTNLSASSSTRAKEPSYPLGPIAPQFVVRPILSNPPPKLLYMGDDGSASHPLRMEHWLRIFGYLEVKDLLACKSVCKTWNCWCFYAPLWKRMDISRRKIKKVHLIAMAKHQPKILDLSHSSITRDQMSWLIERLFHLRRLNLEGCSLSAISSLFFTCNCPLLTQLDLSWVSRLNDNSIKALLSTPTNNKPGITMTGCRLRNCIELKLVGTEVGITSVELISKTLIKLQVLDLSYCVEINSKALEFLANGIQPCLCQTNQLTPSKNQPQQIQAGKHLKHSPITVQGIYASQQLLAGSQPHHSQSASSSPSPNGINNQDHVNSNVSTTSASCRDPIMPLPQLKKLVLIGCHLIDNASISQTRNIRTQLEIIDSIES